MKLQPKVKLNEQTHGQNHIDEELIVRVLITEHRDYLSKYRNVSNYDTRKRLKLILVSLRFHHLFFQIRFDSINDHLMISLRCCLDNDITFHAICDEQSSSGFMITQTTSQQNRESLEQFERKLYDESIVYFYDLPSMTIDDVELADLISNRIKIILQITPIEVKCYSKLAIGYVRVEDNKTKERLLITGTISLNPKDKNLSISLTDTLELTSYIAFDMAKAKNNTDLPQPEQIINRWVELFQGERPYFCEPVNIQFPNLYRIMSTSLNGLLNAMNNPKFSIEDQDCEIFLSSYCSYFEDLPKPTTEDDLQEALCRAIDLGNHVSSPFHIQLNKQANNACIIATDIGRAWATKHFIYLGDKPISKKEYLTCRLVLPFNPNVYTTDQILSNEIFSNKAAIYKRRGNNLILDISDTHIFDQCVRIGVMRVGNEDPLLIEAYTASNDPEECEIDAETWYEREMLRHKSDIMQFINNTNYKIFRYQWNSQIWLEQFQSLTALNNNQTKSPDQSDAILIDERRHLLRMTVMLNTIAAIRNKKYRIADREFDLHLNPNLKTVVYTHESKLQRGGALPMTTTPCSQTSVKVVNDDCLIVYEREVKKGKKPVLLNMASATSPGGGYRKGDGAQEENLFRRSDYFRSLDIDLDHVTEVPSKRFHCTSNCDLDSHLKQDEIYPMDDYGAVYTSGLTVFRQSEETGYAYMENPLKDVCSIAMAAYRDPKLDGNMLANKYAVGMRKKIENIFAIAYHHHHNCLILSAFGCGAFRNPPDHVAKLFHSVIEQYAGFFESVIFAIIDDHNTGHHLNPKGNFSPFEEKFRNCVVKQKVPLNEGNTMFGPYRLLRDGLNVADVSICDLLPCQSGAHCKNLCSDDHTNEFSHPPRCAQDSSPSGCQQLGNNIHMSSYVHYAQCQYGGLCKHIDNEQHVLEFKHPSCCPAGGACQDTSENHEKAYRHLPLCETFHTCIAYRSGDRIHCDAFRHCTPRCEHGSNCANFHDKNHIGKYKHPFQAPCPRTPYHCHLHDQFTQATDKSKVSNDVYQHCCDFAHVCRYGSSL